jgi:hypothetical protein
VGKLDGSCVGEGDGINEGLWLGIGVVGNFVGLGDGIREGEALGRGVVGNAVGAGEGIADGMAVGDGDGIKEGLVVGEGVVGDSDGWVVGMGVGAQLSQFSVISVAISVIALISYTLQTSVAIGGMFCHCSSSPLKIATFPLAETIAHFSEVYDHSISFSS